jgi:hypothetical protein
MTIHQADMIRGQESSGGRGKSWAGLVRRHGMAVLACEDWIPDGINVSDWLYTNSSLGKRQRQEMFVDAGETASQPEHLATAISNTDNDNDTQRPYRPAVHLPHKCHVWMIQALNEINHGPQHRKCRTFSSTYTLDTISDMHTTAGARIRAAAPKSHSSDHRSDRHVGL